MKNLTLSIVGLLILCSCGEENELEPSTELRVENNVPIVQSSPLYDMIINEDITYGEGLSHESLNSLNATRFPLKLDVYRPDNELQDRPVFLFIHGGGFVGGSKQQSNIVNFAEYYASRGWVFISVDYRLKDDNGTVPEEWVEHAATFPPEDSGTVRAIYPAQRDAKAAMRWLVAHADTLRVNTDYITVGGGSAGAITAVTVGISNEGDFRDELSTDQDPTLDQTHLDQTYRIRTIIDLWGSKVALDLLEGVYDHERFDTGDPPLFIAHGTEDNTVPFAAAEELKAIYESFDIPLAYYPLEGIGHGAWNAMVDGKRLEELAFEFIVEQQGLQLP
ncbi:MAG: alpha/beta hydrolase [Bacteroidota bacterium]